LKITSRRLVVSLLAAVAVVTICSPVAHAAGGGDPFAGLGDSLQSNIPIWAGIMAMIAAMVVGGALYYGSQNAGKWVGRFIGGTVFILLATMGRDLLGWLSTTFGIGTAQ
jgi:type IV secretory pathway VirB2 component (pilin)